MKHFVAYYDKKIVIKSLYEINICVLEWHSCHYRLNEFVFCLMFSIHEKMKTCAGMFSNFIGRELFLGCRFLTACHT